MSNFIEVNKENIIKIKKEKLTLEQNKESQRLSRVKYALKNKEELKIIRALNYDKINTQRRKHYKERKIYEPMYLTIQSAQRLKNKHKQNNTLHEVFFIDIPEY